MTNLFFTHHSHTQKKAHNSSLPSSKRPQQKVIFTICKIKRKQKQFEAHIFEMVEHKFSIKFVKIYILYKTSSIFVGYCDNVDYGKLFEEKQLNREGRCHQKTLTNLLKTFKNFKYFWQKKIEKKNLQYSNLDQFVLPAVSKIERDFRKKTDKIRPFLDF